LHSTKTNKLPINRQSFVLLLSPVFLFLLTLDEQYISLHLILSLYHLRTHTHTHAFTTYAHTYAHTQTHIHTHTHRHLSFTPLFSLSFLQKTHTSYLILFYVHTHTHTHRHLSFTHMLALSPTCYLFLSYTHTTFQSPRRKLIPLKLSVDSSLNYLQLKFFQILSLSSTTFFQKNFFSRLVLKFERFT
jgi:hypothetical protein